MENHWFANSKHMMMATIADEILEKIADEINSTAYVLLTAIHGRTEYICI